MQSRVVIGWKICTISKFSLHQLTGWLLYESAMICKEDILGFRQEENKNTLLELSQLWAEKNVRVADFWIINCCIFIRNLSIALLYTHKDPCVKSQSGAYLQRSVPSLQVNCRNLESTWTLLEFFYHIFCLPIASYHFKYNLKI